MSRGNTIMTFIADYANVVATPRLSPARVPHQLCEVLAEQTPLLISYMDAKQRILYVNQHYAQWYGQEQNAFIGRHLRTVIGESAYKTTAQYYQAALQGRIGSFEIHLSDYAGQVHVMKGTCIPHVDELGSVDACVTLLHDITERKEEEEALKRHNHELEALNRMSGLLHTCHSEQETYRVLVDACQELFPSSAGCLCLIDETQIMLDAVASWGAPPLEVKVFGVNDSWVLSRRGNSVSDLPAESFDITLGYYPDDGYMCVPIMNDEKTVALLTICAGSSALQSISEHTAQPDMLLRIAEHYGLSLMNLRLREALRMESIRDALTGLYNRRYMEESLRREAVRAERHNSTVGLIMIDIDHFKRVNDQYGHQAGDVVLKELGALFLRHIRGEDIACRYGGEEFFLILPDIPIEVAQQRAEELRVLVREMPIKYQGKTLSVTISLGVAVLRGYGFGIQGGVETADAALYQAKTRGRDQVVLAAY